MSHRGPAELATATTTRLLFTVGGGLETLAENEVREQFGAGGKGDVEVAWRTRGNSGSQLEASVPATTSSPGGGLGAERIAAAASNLRFVDYVYLRILSKRIECGAEGSKKGENILRGVREVASTDISPHVMDAALCAGRLCQEVLRDRDVGLEKLPGRLFPTPKVEMASSSIATVQAPPPSKRARSDDWVVNTVYTRDEVAKVVVDAFVGLVREYYPSRFDVESSDEGVVWLDAGTGSGALLRHLPQQYSVGVDTRPTCDDRESLNVVRADFLTATKEQMLGDEPSSGNADRTLCVISNPPFSDRSRGDYSAIVKFVNRAADLGAFGVGVIAPVKFARERIWKSLGMDGRARLLARFLLPDGAFYDPSGDGGKAKHINSMFLFFALEPTEDAGANAAEDGGPKSKQKPGVVPPPASSDDAIHVVGRRNKGSFPQISTAELAASVARGLAEEGTDGKGVKLGSEDEASFTLYAKLLQEDDTKSKQGKGGGSVAASAVLELDLLLNPKRPLSLSNCASRRVREHTLGWISSSAKPPVAYAMLKLATAATEANDGGSSAGDDVPAPSNGGSRVVRKRRRAGLLVNAMSGEGTIELEAQGGLGDDSSFFLIGGDKDASAASETSRRLASLRKGDKRPPLVDVVIWDAQRLPLRRDVADAYLADLPFAGSKKKKAKKHQQPCPSGSASEASLDYRLVTAEALRILRPGGGRAALLSADTKAMDHAAGNLHWSTKSQSAKAMNLGGLCAKLSVMEKRGTCGKDVSAWVREGSKDLSVDLLLIAKRACAGYALNAELGLDDKAEATLSTTSIDRASLVDRVELRHTFFDEENKRLSHCYRIYFDDRITNKQAKVLEKAIRRAIEETPPVEVLQLR